MQVSFGTFSKRRNSTKRPTSELSDTRDVKLKQATSLDSPTFILTGNDFNFNYCQYGNRYYFVTDIRSIHDNLSEVDCILDPLATAKDYILQSVQYVCYSSHNSNTWLPDTRIPLVKATKTARNTASLSSLFNTNGFYVLTAVGKQGCVAYAMDLNTLTALLSDIQSWEDDGVLAAMQQITAPGSSYSRAPYHVPASNGLQDCFDALCTTLVQTFESLGNMFTDAQQSMATALASVGGAAVTTGFVGNAYQIAPQCIRSCIWVPFFASQFASSGTELWLGNYKANLPYNPFKLKADPVTGSVSVAIPWHYSDWRRGICEDVYLYLPMVGMIKLSADSITNVSTISVKYSATATDGVVCYEVKADGNVIGTYAGQCSANYPIGINQQASAGEIVQSIIGGASKMASAAAKSSLSPISMAGAGAGLVAETIGATYDTINIENSTHLTTVGGIGGGAGSGLDLNVQCYTVCHEPVMTPSDMQATMGLPTMMPMQMSTLTGYCQCANAHVEAPLMAHELDAIDMYLNSGFFIE